MSTLITIPVNIKPVISVVLSNLSVKFAIYKAFFILKSRKVYMSIIILNNKGDKNEYIAVFRRYKIGGVTTCKKGINEIISDC